MTEMETVRDVNPWAVFIIDADFSWETTAFLSASGLCNYVVKLPKIRKCF